MSSVPTIGSLVRNVPEDMWLAVASQNGNRITVAKLVSLFKKADQNYFWQVGLITSWNAHFVVPKPLRPKERQAMEVKRLQAIYSQSKKPRTTSRLNPNEKLLRCQVILAN